MAFGGFLQGLGLAFGNQLMYGQQYEKQKASTDLMKSEALIEGTKAQQMQQQIKTQKDLADFISSQSKLEGAKASQPLEQARMYQKAADLALQHGDMQSAQEMMKISREASQDAREQVTVAAQQQAQKKDALGTVAQSYAQNPTPEAARDVVRAALDAGVNPATIPMPNTPQWGAWVKDQQLAGMTSKDRAEFAQKTADIKARRDLQLQEHQDNVSLRAATIQQTGAYREAMIGLKREEIASRADKAPKTIDVAGSTYEYDPQGSVKGDRLATDSRYVKLGQKVTATQENNITAIAGASAEVARNLQQMARFPTGTVTSPFSHMTDHDFVSALSKTGSNILTPEQVQMFTTSSAGMAQELSRVLTLGGGRGPNQTVINEIRAQITPVAGDTNLEAAYKLSTGAQITLTRMKNTPAPADAGAKAEWDATIKNLEQFPTPEQVLSAASGKQKQTLKGMQSDYHSLLQTVKNLPTVGDAAVPGLPGSPDTGAGTSAPPLPAGWSVKVH